MIGAVAARVFASDFGDTVERDDVIVAHVERHADEAAWLRTSRTSTVRSPRTTLAVLANHDARLDAHLDGLRVAGRHGRRAARRLLDGGGPGEFFVATVCAIESRDHSGVEALIAAAFALHGPVHGMLSAFGWVSAARLRGLAAHCLHAMSPDVRKVGLAACEFHRVDAGRAATDAMHDLDPSLRARAFRQAGLLGRVDLLDACVAGSGDSHPAVRFDALRSAVRLGDVRYAPEALARLAEDDDRPMAERREAIGLALRAASRPDAQRLLVRLIDGTVPLPLAIEAAAAAGETRVLPWLIEQIRDARFTQLAAEAIALMSGLDLTQIAGPMHETADTEELALRLSRAVAMLPADRRLFLGGPPSIARCRQVLRLAGQTQRRAAAEHLVLLCPGQALFDTTAPAWRQRHLLSQADA